MRSHKYLLIAHNPDDLLKSQAQMTTYTSSDFFFFLYWFAEISGRVVMETMCIRGWVWFHNHFQARICMGFFCASATSHKPATSFQGNFDSGGIHSDFCANQSWNFEVGVCMVGEEHNDLGCVDIWRTDPSYSLSEQRASSRTHFTLLTRWWQTVISLDALIVW